MIHKMIDKVLDNVWLWDLSRYFLDLTCGLYKKRIGLVKNLDLLKDTFSVLDIGCGTGLFAEITNGHYVGIDSNCRSIERAKRKRYKTEKIFRCVDLNVLLEEKTMFDVILIVDLLHHLNDSECADLLRASAQMTKKYLIIFEDVLKKEMSLVLKWFIKHDKGSYFRYIDDLNKLFRSGGYKVLENREVRMGYLSTHFILCISS